MQQKPLIILTGPTAVGKTSLSIRLAKEVDGEIISADSMQVYRHMDIGTAKITTEEMEGIPHHLIDEFEPDEEFHVVKFKEYTKRYIEEIYQRNKVPVLVGGTGFYIQAVLYDIDFKDSKPEEETACREELRLIAEEKGNDFLHNMLFSVDEKAAANIHKNNVKRVIRALEYYHTMGQKISLHNEEQQKKTSPYQSCYFVLNQDRDILYQRIDKRVDDMVQNGLVEEVRHLREIGCKKESVSMQGLGYKEILSYLDGECTLKEAVDILKRDTRHFAKRQITWFKREKEVIWLNKEAFANDDTAILKSMTTSIYDTMPYLDREKRNH